MNGFPALALEGVSVRYRSVPVVRDVTVAVAPGQWAALIGPNGAGKTSVLRAAAALVPYDGTITVHGTALRDLRPRDRARRVAYLPQQPTLPARMSVLRYTMLGRHPYTGRFRGDSDEDEDRCVSVLQRLGLDRSAHRDLAGLSGGEVQRVVLARALAQDAPVLLLDEPTSALDLRHRVEVLELLDTLRHDGGLSIVSALHDLTLAGQFADRLLLLHQGRLVHQGAPADVLDNRLLTRCFGTEVQVVTGDGSQRLVAPRRRTRARDTGHIID